MLLLSRKRMKFRPLRVRLSRIIIQAQERALYRF